MAFPSKVAVMAVSMAAVTALWGVPAAGAEDVALAYDIRKEGEPIGREQVRIARADDGSAVVEVQTRTRAKVLFMEFRYDHSRREEWKGGKLVRMVADTDDDGTKSHLETVRSADGWTVTVNGHSSPRAGDPLPLTLWGKAVVGKGELYSIIDAKPYRVQVASLGTETITLDGGTVSAERFRISGDVERDLWYDADGYLLKAAFQRSGYPIEIVRSERRP